MSRFLTSVTIAVFLASVAQGQTRKGTLEVDNHVDAGEIRSVTVSFPCEVTITGHDLRVSYTGEESKRYLLDGLIDGKRIVMAQTKRLYSTITTFHYVGYFTNASTIEGMGTVMRNGVVGGSYFTFRIKMNDSTQPERAANGNQPVNSQTNRTPSAAGSRR